MATPQQPVFRDLTRTNKFQKKFQLPPNFSAVLKDFTREVLREQPDDIYAYGAQYFKRLALRQDGKEVPAPALRSKVKGAPPAADPAALQGLRNQLTDAFAEEDYDNTGRLTAPLIKRVLQGSCQLSPEQTTFLISVAHDNLDQRDCSIDYERFSGDIVHYLHYFMTKGYTFQEQRHKDEDTVHGLTKEELASQLNSIFQQADATGIGRLPVEQYNDCLRRVPLQLTHRDITLLTAEAEVSEDNCVVYSREAEAAFPILYLAQSFDAFQDAWDEGRLA